MTNPFSRRNFLKAGATFPLAGITSLSLFNSSSGLYNTPNQNPSYKIKLSLNAYSFNEQLREGAMSLEEFLEFAAEHNFDAVDLTGYYFPHYPLTPSDEFIYHIKNKALKLGLSICGTGVRNDFANPDAAKRKEGIHVVKSWITCAAKMGAPIVRIFTGPDVPDGYSRREATDWMVEDIKTCTEFGRKNGVMVAIQNHFEFLKTADQTLDIIRRVDSPWLGLMLDIGSYRSQNPYEEIKASIPYAVNWQIKEDMYINENRQKTDFPKIMKIMQDSGYRGFVNLETLSPGDPYEEVPILLKEVREALG